MNGELETTLVNISIMNKKGRNSKFEKTITINTSSVCIGDPMYALSHERFVNLSHKDGPIVLMELKSALHIAFVVVMALSLVLKEKNIGLTPPLFQSLVENLPMVIF